MKRSLKRVLCGTMVFALIVPDLAMAQVLNQTRERPGATQPAQTKARPAARPAKRPATRPAKPPTARPVTRPARPVTRPVQRPAQTRPRPPQANRPVVRPARPVVQPTRPVVRPSRPIHSPGYRPSQVRRINVSVYHYPRGYRYRRWVSGRILPRIFLSNAYYYDNWYGLGFGPPPHGYRWVRYGPDLLLVSLRTGRIVDVVYGVFY